MKTTAIVSVLSVAAVSAGTVLPTRAMFEAKFIDWCSEHNIHFSSGEEFVTRLSNWIENDMFIQATNAREELTFEVGHNAFSHMTQEEFVQYFNLGKGAPARSGLRKATPADNLAYPTSLDWRSLGGVTGVKDQGQCGSCWSFSTTGAVEGQYARKTGSLVSFSEQNLVDCDTSDYGCHGGLMDNAFAWIKKNGGLCTESAYPYVSGGTGSRNTCKTTCSKVSGSTVSSWFDLAQTDSAMVAALQNGPVSVAIVADSRSFQLYKSGVYNDASCGTNLDHGVLNVGYGTMTGGDYWIVKNSWGTSWGSGGYIYLARNTGVAGGMCGVLMQASQPAL